MAPVLLLQTDSAYEQAQRIKTSQFTEQVIPYASRTVIHHLGIISHNRKDTVAVFLEKQFIATQMLFCTLAT